MGNTDDMLSFNNLYEQDMNEVSIKWIKREFDKN